jgi:hypothetical protein
LKELLFFQKPGMNPAFFSRESTITGSVRQLLHPIFCGYICFDIQGLPSYIHTMKKRVPFNAVNEYHRSFAGSSAGDKA